MVSRTFTILLSFFVAHAHAQERETVIIETQRDAEERAWNSAASVTVLPIDTDVPMSTTIATLVDQAPGVRLQTFGDADSFSGVSIRGSTMRQVGVYLDGIPLNPEGGQAVNLSEWPLRAFTRVEVYRGNAPSHLGGAALGGVINLVRDDAFQGSSSAGSVNTNGRFSLDGNMTASPEIRQHEHLVSAFLNAVVNRGQFEYYSDNGTPYNRLDDDRQIREHNASSTFHALLGWKTQVGNGSINILDAWMNKGSELPGHINNPASAARLNTTRNLLGVRYDPGINGHQAHVVAWWLSRSEQFRDALDELGLGAQDVAQQTTNLGLRLHDTFSLSSDVAFGATLGLIRDASHAENASPGSIQDIPKAQGRTVETLTLDMPVQFGRWGATPVLHSTLIQHQGRASSATFDPRLGVQYGVSNRFIIRANGGRYLRPPDATELFGDRGSMRGNPDLEPETGWQWDLGGRLRMDTSDAMVWTLDLGHFWNASKGRIAWVQNGQRTMVPVNLGKTWVQGFEIAAQGEILEIVQTETNLTWVQSRNLSSKPGIANNPLPSVPPTNIWHSTALELLQHKVRVAHTIRHVSANFLDETNWIRSPPRTVQDIVIQGQPTEKWPTIELGVTNLADTIAEVVPSNPLDSKSERVLQPVTDFAGYPLPGRTFTLSLRWNPGGER